MRTQSNIAHIRIADALSLTSAVKDWLTDTRQPRVLHIFDRACNLINERGEILSIVTPEIGNSPFNLVVDTEVLFSGHLHVESSISILEDQLLVGNLTINTAHARLWNPRPNWELLHSKRNDIRNHIIRLSLPNYNETILKFSNSLAASVASADLPSSLLAARKLAGLGQGLTPSGDDFIIGALHAAWIIHPREIASELAEKIAETAAPLTTSLSAAWIRSAGRGKAGELWHQFFDTLISGDRIRINESFEKILSVGETSGADALAGFVGVFSAGHDNGHT